MHKEQCKIDQGKNNTDTSQQAYGKGKSPHLLSHSTGYLISPPQPLCFRLLLYAPPLPAKRHRLPRQTNMIAAKKNSSKGNKKLKRIEESKGRDPMNKDYFFIKTERDGKNTTSTGLSPKINDKNNQELVPTYRYPRSISGSKRGSSTIHQVRRQMGYKNVRIKSRGETMKAAIYHTIRLNNQGNVLRTNQILHGQLSSNVWWLTYTRRRDQEGWSSCTWPTYLSHPKDDITFHKKMCSERICQKLLDNDSSTWNIKVRV